MELWMVAGIIGGGIAFAAFTRLLRSRRVETEETKNIYTLW